MAQRAPNHARRANARVNPRPDPQSIDSEAGHAATSNELFANTNLPLLLTVNDFLQHFGIGRTSFYREVSRGRLTIIKFGTATRITQADAAAWLANLPRVIVPSSGSNARQ